MKYAMGLITKIVLCTLFLITVDYSYSQSSLLWKITGKNARSPSYLFGTIHIMCETDIVVPEALKKSFASSKQLYLEMDMDDPGMMQGMMAGMMMKDSSIDQFLDQPTFDTVSSLFQKRTGFPLTMMKTMKPFFLTALLYPSMMNCQPESWEKTFQSMAEKQGIKLYGVETLQDQLQVVETIPYKIQAEQLAKTLLNIDSVKSSFNQLLNIYKSKNLDSIYNLTASDPDFGSYEAKFLNDRNAKWMPIMDRELQKTSTFFAFGAAHLGGKNGLISLLRKKGYTVQPITF